MGYFFFFIYVFFENVDVVDVNNSLNGEVYVLNLLLVKWVYLLIKDIKFLNNEVMDVLRVKYINLVSVKVFLNVFMGVYLFVFIFWYGEKLNMWVNDWVVYWM